MRILIATWHRNLVGGAEKYLQTLLPALTHRGHQVGLAYERSFDPVREAIDQRESSLATWCLADLGLERLMCAVAEWQPDIVYSHGLEQAKFEHALLDIYPT